ncbi:uncharacterized protein BHQ10_002347 [Talaromyces amestolkiae]|uniref:Uncharacterized protein n=1 Tax=Talaromyces amestolkiae TaxID=1196081 RepID=A0A364KS18_TALAM|nr:uncharacterized protein BHQ10_002347 [Talaromyces amestolkiae]RAO66335.1 hypothetical protein BHQ10_002347 [Talaromyces amestolkiae]
MTEATKQIHIALDNTGDGPLRVPGFANIPIHYELPSNARFAHGVVEWRQAPAVTARELTMVAVMNHLTDRPSWYLEISDDEVVANWKQETFDTTPLMSEKAWEWCVRELRDKAVDLRESRQIHIRVLDTGSCVCKADAETLDSLSAAFRESMPALLEEQQEQRILDWQSETVLIVVDPLLFPLVYGRSLVLVDGGQVDFDNVLGSYRDATVAPKPYDRRTNSESLQMKIDRLGTPCWGIGDPDGDKFEFYHWSANYQCLPCEVKFLHDSGTEVQITSYINNLHPAHEGLYQAIEKLISITIKPWNDCLVKGQIGWDDDSNQGQLGPVPLRIITYGAEWENELPEWALTFRVPTEHRIKKYHKFQEMLQSNKDDQTRNGRRKYRHAQGQLRRLRDVSDNLDKKLPPPESDLWKRAKEYLELPENGSNTPVAAPDGWMEGDSKPWWSIERKLERLLRFKHPEPGTAFSYEEWKTNRHNDKAIIDIVRHRNNWAPDRQPFKPIIPPHSPYTISLQDTFRKQGLQIIVKMENIELTPQNPTYTNDSWQLDGQLNEHIAAVAIFAYDVSNITSPKISFRQNTTLYGDFYQILEELYTTGNYDARTLRAHRCGKGYGQDLWAVGSILGYENPWHLSIDYNGMLSYQDIGSVATPQGRLITFPSVLEYKAEPFQLLDATLPGHYRSIKMFLIDPHYRVCSTRNVPPQQHHWWTQEAGKELTSAGLPYELVDEIFRGTEDWPMGREEAKQHRHNLTREHIWNETARFNRMPGPGF